MTAVLAPMAPKRAESSMKFMTAQEPNRTGSPNRPAAPKPAMAEMPDTARRSAGAALETIAGPLIRNANNLSAYLTANRTTIEQAGAGKIDTDRVIKYCARLVESPKNRDLLHCTLRSFTLALCECLALGISPEMGRGCFIPADGEVSFVLGYQGMLELAARSGIHVRAHNVFKGDKFEWYAGADERIVHEPNIEIRRCEETFLCAYCVSTAGGKPAYDVMLKNEIDAVRDRAGEFNMAWASDYLEMARKTVVRRASKFWPLSGAAPAGDFSSTDSTLFVRSH